MSTYAFQLYRGLFFAAVFLTELIVSSLSQFDFRIHQIFRSNFLAVLELFEAT